MSDNIQNQDKDKSTSESSPIVSPIVSPTVSPTVIDVSKESVSKSISTVLEGEKEEDGEEEKDDKGLGKNDSSLTLKLGDIIEIIAPNNQILNAKTFIIEYIDPTKIKLVDADSFKKIQLNINGEGHITDKTITKITLLSRNENEGYARQNDLLTGTWINIYFGGDIPTIITGLITNLEDDMIEIKTVDNETIYIDFGYQGIPEDIPIETFEIRPPPESSKKDSDKGQ